MNGRVYPQTILEHGDPSLPSQPISSLVRAAAGDRVLLRLANLGYEQHAMQLPGIPMRVVGQDATLLRNGTVDQSYVTNTLYIGPGEARDVLFTAPLYAAASPGGTDVKGAYNRYFLKNRDAAKLTNAGAPGLGGMATEVRVYASLPAPALQPNNTYA
jgi:FtsP/CotA-like multicopper oxidase with cupredoxin domain